jgi:hypothetical protein
MNHAEARRIARDPSADPFDRYDARKILSEPERRPEPEQKRTLDTAPREPDWSAWNDWCDSRIEAKLAGQRRFLLEVVGEALGEYVASERKIMKRELADELRQLRIELAETQATVRELRSVLASDRRTPLDLPALPRRGLN